MNKFGFMRFLSKMDEMTFDCLCLFFFSQKGRFPTKTFFFGVVLVASILKSPVFFYGYVNDLCQASQITARHICLFFNVAKKKKQKQIV
jgi:hypothetical protein